MKIILIILLCLFYIDAQEEKNNRFIFSNKITNQYLFRGLIIDNNAVNHSFFKYSFKNFNISALYTYKLSRQIINSNEVTYNDIHLDIFYQEDKKYLLFSIGTKVIFYPSTLDKDNDMEFNLTLNFDTILNPLFEINYRHKDSKGFYIKAGISEFIEVFNDDYVEIFINIATASSMYNKSFYNGSGIDIVNSNIGFNFIYNIKTDIEFWVGFSYSQLLFNARNVQNSLQSIITLGVKVSL